ncbi:MAG TPA: FAD-dependent oxidoreductase, partial [Spirochaetia bacterium]|nr:FAD-dependent oxidoreductase [Spirochaetia bacterium]
SKSGKFLRADWVVNAAGLYADEVSRIFGAEDFRIIPRKGEEVLLERGAASHTERIVFPVPSARSKGVLVIPTVEGTTMLGPTAEAGQEKEDLGTTETGLQTILDSSRLLVPAVSERSIITAFAGMRPTLPGEDFSIDLSRKVPHLVQVAGIQSPGLTAAPALAEYVGDLLRRGGLRLVEKLEYDPEIPEVKRLRNAELSEIDLLVSADPDYGEIVCQCETVSAAEIKAAVQRGHTTLDGIQFYTRAGMGRCQGGFCTYKTAEILAREKGLAWTELTRRGGGSYVTHDRIGELEVRRSMGDVRDSDHRAREERRSD